MPAEVKLVGDCESSKESVFVIDWQRKRKRRERERESWFVYARV